MSCSGERGTLLAGWARLSSCTVTNARLISRFVEAVSVTDWPPCLHLQPWVHTRIHRHTCTRTHTHPHIHTHTPTHPHSDTLAHPPPHPNYATYAHSPTPPYTYIHITVCTHRHRPSLSLSPSRPLLLPPAGGSVQLSDVSAAA